MMRPEQEKTSNYPRSAAHVAESTPSLASLGEKGCERRLFRFAARGPRLPTATNPASRILFPFGDISASQKNRKIVSEYVGRRK